MAPNLPILSPPPSLGLAGRNPVLAELWRTLFPWEQLEAKNPPDRRLELGQDILPTLAVMVAAGGGVPALLMTDDHGRLQVSDAPYDWSNLVDGGHGVAAQVSVGGRPGTLLVLDTLIVALSDLVGAADSKIVRVFDGVFGVSPLLATFRIGIPATAGAIDHLNLTGLKVTGSAGQQMDIGFGTAGANQDETIFAAGYFRKEAA